MGEQTYKKDGERVGFVENIIKALELNKAHQIKELNPKFNFKLHDHHQIKEL